MIKKGIDYRVKGYYNRWYVIASLKKWSLLENCTWGDETCHLVVRNDVTVIDKAYRNTRTNERVVLPTIQETVCETYDDLQTALEDIGLL